MKLKKTLTHPPKKRIQVGYNLDVSPLSHRRPLSPLEEPKSFSISSLFFQKRSSVIKQHQIHTEQERGVQRTRARYCETGIRVLTHSYSRI